MKKLSFVILFFLLSVITVHAENASEYEKLISNLDLSLPQLSEVQKYAEAGDYEAAAQAFVSYYAQRKTPVWSEMPREPGNSTSYNTADADNITKLLFYYNGELISAANPDGSVNWRLKPEGQKEWMWTFNRQFQFVTLSRAYVNTGKRIYAEAFEKQFNDWYINNPMPETLDTEDTWRTLEAGIRIGSSMISYFNNFVMSNEISLLTKTRILLSLHEHGQYLSQYSGTNNWLLMESKGFYSLVYMFPEFKDSEAWKGIILERLDNDFSTQFLEDGWQHELTPNYHIESVKSVFGIWDMADKNGDILPYADKLMKTYTSAQAVMGAGTFILPLNDTHSVNQSDFMYQGALLSERQNAGLAAGFLASASGGLYGEPNAALQSKFFENAGYIIMRDQNNKNGPSAFFEVGASGIGGHGWMSRDKLQFTLTAFDRELLIDTGGSTTYGQDPLSRYTYTTPAHNTVTIDGYEQVRRNSNHFTHGTESTLLRSDKLEYAQGIYDEKYDETRLLDVTHKRRVAFVKSEYFVIRDELAGAGSHTARQHWNFAPGKYVEDKNTGIFRTDFEDGNNVMVIPVKFTGCESGCGQTSPMMGWTSEGIETLNFCYKQDFTDFGTLETIIVPYQGRIPPDITVLGEQDCIKIKYKDFTDLVFFNQEAVSVERTYLDGHTELLDFTGQPEQKIDERYPVIPCNGTIQAEWSGFAQENLEYHYDEAAKSYGTVVFRQGARQILRAEYGMSALTLRAKGQGTLKINDRLLAINSGTFQDYTVYGIAGGKISISCIEGTAAVDEYRLDGWGEPINIQAVRQRLPCRQAELIFTQKPTGIYAVSADFMPIRSLTAAHTPYFGFEFGACMVRYNAADNQMELSWDGTVISSCPYYLHYGEWHRLSVEIVDGKLKAYVNGSMLLCENIALADGNTGIVSSYMDLYVDNLTINDKTNAFENNTVGTRPSGFAENGGKWLVEGIENQYDDMRISPSAATVLPGTEVTLMLNRANGAKLLRNNTEVEYTDDMYTFIAPLGITSFCLKTEGQVSETVEIRAVSDTYVKSVPLSEDFSQSALNSSWKYTAGFVPLDGKWYLSGLKQQQTEVYNNLAVPVKNKASIECTFIPDSNLSEIKLFICRDSGNRELQLINFAAGGNIVDSVTNEKIGCYTPGMPNRIRMDMDIARGTYSVYNNGALLSADRPMGVKISDIKRIYAAKIWNGVSGAYISDFRLQELADLPNAIRIQKKVGQSMAFSEKYCFKNDSLYAASYEAGRLSALNVLRDMDVFGLGSKPVRLFDWEGMTPFSTSGEYYCSLTPGYAGEDYFYQNFDRYNGGIPDERWGGTVESLSAFNGGVFMSGNPAGMAELYYDCLNCLEGTVAVMADITAESDRNRIQLLTFRDADGKETQTITYGKDGKIYDCAGKAISVYKAGQKNKIRLEIDIANQAYDLWIDNTRCARDIPLGGQAAGVKRIYLAKINKGNSGVMIDNFTVSRLEDNEGGKL